MRSGIKLADVYYRLSNEEANRGESSSITNQREIVTAFCEENGILIVSEFVDDGYSGSNFDRPGFQRMLEHIASSKVNMVITKDLSRLGRDMAESSRYAERYFPEHGIHYIAISDNFDSESSNLLAPFQFAMNDVYLRDTSRKVKQVLDHKKKSGQYCACPPFGYMKDPKRAGHLIPDPDTAPIVKRIFALASQGQSTRTIAKILDEEGAITPLKYRVLYRDTFSEAGASRAADHWNFVTVKRILRNRVYLGHTILGKSKKVSVKSKVKVALPEEEWFVTKDTHEPLVTQAEFDAAERYLGENTKAWRDHPSFRHSIFNGIAFCENCGAAMCSAGTVYKGERDRYWYLACSNLPQRTIKRCEHAARIRYEDLIEVVRCDLNALISLSDDEISEITEAAVAAAQKSGGATQRIEQLRQRLSEIDRMIKKLYHDNISGRINDEMLDRLVGDLTREEDELKAKLRVLEEREQTANAERNSYDEFFSLARSYAHIDVLTRDVLMAFVERIEIGEKILPPGIKVASHRIPYTQSIRIVYRFIGDLGNPIRTINNNQ